MSFHRLAYCIYEACCRCLPPLALDGSMSNRCTFPEPLYPLDVAICSIELPICVCVCVLTNGEEAWKCNRLCTQFVTERNLKI